MTDAMFMELLAIVGLANETNSMRTFVTARRRTRCKRV